LFVNLMLYFVDSVDWPETGIVKYDNCPKRRES
jgi:hypothetical protein